jgi:hypothetical protein
MKSGNIFWKLKMLHLLRQQMLKTQKLKDAGTHKTQDARRKTQDAGARLLHTTQAQRLIQSISL